MSLQVARVAGLLRFLSQFPHFWNFPTFYNKPLDLNLTINFKKRDPVTSVPFVYFFYKGSVPWNSFRGPCSCQNLQWCSPAGLVFSERIGLQNFPKSRYQLDIGKSVDMYSLNTSK